ncbi:MAG: dihydroneopterin aldolase [Acidobacteriota bacterium]|jgi:dihydroneopterin aldolase|nr:dihydroneopterin aldolase [Acidobacteriota bacterium]
MASDKPMDRLRLSGVKVFPRIGVTDDERAMPQECEADLEILGDWSGAAATDDLGRSIDYALVLEKVRETAAAREYLLLETLAYAVLERVCADFPVAGAKVRVRKRPVRLREKLDYVEVEVGRGDDRR